ncbi:MAG: hypothetical protein IPM39_04775 [Chloroflexi bacterium]|nr:hypothetical protein [Chloroflexota bacterium]
MIANGCQPTTWPGTEWRSTSQNLKAKIDDLLTLAQQAAFAEESDVWPTQVWATQLAKVRETMRTAVEEADLDQLSSASRLLFRIINRQPSRLNAQLIITTKALRLQNLATAVTTICANIDASNLEGSELVSQIRQDSGALGSIDAHLQRLAAEHDAWQAIEDELRRVESTLDSGLGELHEAWPDLQPMTGRLLADKTEAWASDLQTVMASLGQAIEEAVIVTARRLFRRFRSQIGRRFRQVDVELLSLCHDLQKVGESLDLVLRTVK